MNHRQIVDEKPSFDDEDLVILNEAFGDQDCSSRDQKHGARATLRSVVEEPYKLAVLCSFVLLSYKGYLIENLKAIANWQH